MKPEVDLVIRGARVVSPDQIIEASVAIAGEAIVAGVLAGEAIDVVLRLLPDDAPDGAVQLDVGVGVVHVDEGDGHARVALEQRP